MMGPRRWRRALPRAASGSLRRPRETWPGLASESNTGNRRPGAVTQPVGSEVASAKISKEDTHHVEEQGSFPRAERCHRLRPERRGVIHTAGTIPAADEQTWRS